MLSKYEIKYTLAISSFGPFCPWNKVFFQILSILSRDGMRKYLKLILLTSHKCLPLLLNTGMLLHPLSQPLLLPEDSNLLIALKEESRWFCPLRWVEGSHKQWHEQWISQLPLLFNHPSCRPLFRGVIPVRASVPLCPRLQWEEIPTGAKKLVASQFSDLAGEPLLHIFIFSSDFRPCTYFSLSFRFLFQLAKTITNDRA